MPASPETRIAIANASAIVKGRALLIGFGPELAEVVPGATVFHQNLRAHRAHPGSLFGAWLAEGEYDTVAIGLPKAVGRLRLVLAMSRALLVPGGRVVLAGHNDAGIRPAAGVLDEMIGSARTADTRYHCRIYEAVLEQPKAATMREWRVEFEQSVNERQIRIVSYPGLFAHGRVDDGTAMLLSALTIPPGARALDVGSGTGVIGGWLRAGGVAVDCVDVDAVAVAASEETLSLNGEQAARAWASDLFSDVEEKYTHIVANVPFHAGMQRTLGIAAPLIRGSSAHLERHGELWAVTNRQLDLRQAFDDFAHVEVVRENGRFRVWRAR